MAKFVVYEGDGQVIITTEELEREFRTTMEGYGIYLKMEDWDRMVIPDCCVSIERGHLQVH